MFDSQFGQKNIVFCNAFIGFELDIKLRRPLIDYKRGTWVQAWSHQMTHALGKHQVTPPANLCLWMWKEEDFTWNQSEVTLSLIVSDSQWLPIGSIKTQAMYLLHLYCVNKILSVLPVARVQFPATVEYFKGFVPDWLHSANPSWASVAENGSISPQRHHTTCGQRGGRPKFNHGQMMADRKKKKKKY